MTPPAGPDGQGPDGRGPDGRGPDGRGPDGQAASPNGTPAGSPFDDSGRLIGMRRRPSASGSLPLGRTSSGALPLQWTHSGSMPVERPADGSGGLTLTGSIALGRRSKRLTLSGRDPVVRGRGLARLSGRPQPTTASELQRAVVRWVVTLWAITVLFQRFQVPNQPVALILPLALLWCVYGLVRGVLEVDRHRFAWWLAIAGLSAAFVPLQYALVDRPFVSITSWGLLMTTWLVFVFRLRDRRRQTYVLALRGIVKVCMWLAILVIVMLASQLVFPYRDWFAEIVPDSLRLTGFTISYPISYGSPFYKGNGWIGLEPSVVSFQLGLGLVAAIVIRSTMPVVALLGLGILCTTAGSGVAIVLVGVVVVLFSAMRWALARYSLLVLPLVAFAVTPWAEPILSRATEGTGSDSSTGQRAVQPYTVLWPRFTSEPIHMLLGSGPGSSQEIITNAHVRGLLVPTPLKIFFDYGLIAGLGLAAFLLFMYLGGPSRAMAIALGASLWTLQPGTTTMVFVVAVPLVVTWWTPRTRPPIESDHVPSPNATLAPPGARPRSEVRV